MISKMKDYKDRKVTETYLERLRRLIEEQYPMGFGAALCYELHTNNLHFVRLAKKWGISVTALGELIYDHCKRLEEDPCVNIPVPLQEEL